MKYVCISKKFVSCRNQVVAIVMPDRGNPRLILGYIIRRTTEISSVFSALRNFFLLEVSMDQKK